MFGNNFKRSYYAWYVLKNGTTNDRELRTKADALLMAKFWLEISTSVKKAGITEVVE